MTYSTRPGTRNLKSLQLVCIYKDIPFAASPPVLPLVRFEQSPYRLDLSHTDISNGRKCSVMEVSSSQFCCNS